MAAKLYTHKEINDASMAARKEAELVHTVEKLKEQYPLNTTLKIEQRIMTTTWSEREPIHLATFIEQLQYEMDTHKATHVELTVSRAEWCDGDGVDVEFVRMKAETQEEYDARIAAIRENLLNQAYGRVQQEMLRHNDQVRLYRDLKTKFGD